MYKPSLKFETKKEQVKERMMKWAKIFGCNIQMAQWENMWLKRLKFILCCNLNIINSTFIK